MTDGEGEVPAYERIRTYREEPGTSRHSIFFCDLKVKYYSFCDHNVLHCLLFRTLPESPPDSSSEPYSPQQVNGKKRQLLLLFFVHDRT